MSRQETTNLVQTCKNFLVYLSQTDDNCQEAKSQQIEKMLRRMAVLPLLHWNSGEGNGRARRCGGSEGSQKVQTINLHLQDK